MRLASGPFYVRYVISTRPPLHSWIEGVVSATTTEIIMISNYSRIKEFRLCKRKDYFSRKLRLISAAPKIELDYGTAIHEAIPTYLKTRNADAAINAFDSSFQTYLDNPYLLPEQLEDAKAMRRLGHLSIQSYIETWREDFTLVFSEYQDKAPLLDGKHELAFRTDAVISVNGNLWLLERKTLSKSISVNTIIQSFQIDEQPTAYLIGLRKLTGLAISGFLLEIVRKTTIPEIIREPFLRTEEQLKDTEIGLYETMNDMEKVDDLSAQQENVRENENPTSTLQHLYPKSTGTSTCYQFFRPCTFLKLCEAARLTPFGDEFAQKQPDYVDAYSSSAKQENERSVQENEQSSLNEVKA